MKLKRKKLCTMSSRSGTEVPEGGMTSQHGLQSNAGDQDSFSRGALQDPCFVSNANSSEPKIPRFDAAGSGELMWDLEISSCFPLSLILTPCTPDDRLEIFCHVPHLGGDGRVRQNHHPSGEGG